MPACSDKLKEPQGGLDGADIAFITHVTGSTDVGRSAKQNCISLTQRLGLRGPRQRGHMSGEGLYTALPQCVRAERQGQEAVRQDEKLLPKRDKEGITIYFQRHTHFSGQGP